MIVHIAKSCVHNAPLCVCMCAHNPNVNDVLCLVPQKDVKLQVLWKSDLIWLRYMILHIAKSSVHIAPLWVCMWANNPNGNNVLSLVSQKDVKFKIWWKSDFIRLSNMIVHIPSVHIALL